MKVEFDSSRDLLYLYFASKDTKIARTEIVSPGVHIDLDKNDGLVGIEVLDASELMDQKIEFDLSSHGLELVKQ